MIIVVSARFFSPIMNHCFLSHWFYHHVSSFTSLSYELSQRCLRFVSTSRIVFHWPLFVHWLVDYRRLPSFLDQPDLSRKSIWIEDKKKRKNIVNFIHISASYFYFRMKLFHEWLLSLFAIANQFKLFLVSLFQLIFLCRHFKPFECILTRIESIQGWTWIRWLEEMRPASLSEWPNKWWPKEENRQVVQLIQWFQTVSWSCPIHCLTQFLMLPIASQWMQHRKSFQQ